MSNCHQSLLSIRQRHRCTINSRYGTSDSSLLLKHDLIVWQSYVNTPGVNVSRIFKHHRCLRILVDLHNSCHDVQRPWPWFIRIFRDLQRSCQDLQTSFLSRSNFYFHLLLSWLLHVLQELVNFFGKESGAVVDLLSEDSSNIVQLIRDAYEVSAVWCNFDVFISQHGSTL